MYSEQFLKNHWRKPAMDSIIYEVVPSYDFCKIIRTIILQSTCEQLYSFQLSQEIPWFYLFSF